MIVYVTLPSWRLLFVTFVDCCYLRLFCLNPIYHPLDYLPGILLPHFGFIRTARTGRFTRFTRICRTLHTRWLRIADWFTVAILILVCLRGYVLVTLADSVWISDTRLVQQLRWFAHIYVAQLLPGCPRGYGYILRCLVVLRARLFCSYLLIAVAATVARVWLRTLHPSCFTPFYTLFTRIVADYVYVARLFHGYVYVDCLRLVVATRTHTRYGVADLR